MTVPEGQRSHGQLQPRPWLLLGASLEVGLLQRTAGPQEALRRCQPSERAHNVVAVLSLPGCEAVLPTCNKKLVFIIWKRIATRFKILFPEGADETVFPGGMPWDRAPSQQLHLVLVISVSLNDHVLTCCPSDSLGRPLGNNQ